MNSADRTRHYLELGNRQSVCRSFLSQAILNLHWNSFFKGTGKDKQEELINLAITEGLFFALKMALPGSDALAGRAARWFMDSQARVTYMRTRVLFGPNFVKKITKWADTEWAADKMDGTVKLIARKGMDVLNSHAKGYVEQARQVSEAYLQMQAAEDVVIHDEMFHMTNQELKFYLLRYDKDAPETECGITYFQNELTTQKGVLDSIGSMHRPEPYGGGADCGSIPDKQMRDECRRSALDPANAWKEGRGYCKALGRVATRHTRAAYCKGIWWFKTCYPAELKYLRYGPIIRSDYRQHVEKAAKEIGANYVDGDCR